MLWGSTTEALIQTTPYPPCPKGGPTTSLQVGKLNQALAYSTLLNRSISLTHGIIISYVDPVFKNNTIFLTSQRVRRGHTNHYRPKSQILILKDCNSFVICEKKKKKKKSPSFQMMSYIHWLLCKMNLPFHYYLLTVLVLHLYGFYPSNLGKKQPHKI